MRNGHRLPSEVQIQYVRQVDLRSFIPENKYIRIFLFLYILQAQINK